EPFATDYKFELQESGHVPVWPRQICDQPAVDGIGDLDENNRHSASYFLQGFYAAPTNGDDHIRRKRHQFRGIFLIFAYIAAAPTIPDADIGIIGPAQLLQPQLERRGLKARLRIVRDPGHQHADAPHSFALRRARSERPRHSRAAEQRYERAPSHVEHRAFSRLGATVRVYRTLNLPQRGRQVLGADLNCSDSGPLTHPFRFRRRDGKRFPSPAVRAPRAATQLSRLTRRNKKRCYSITSSASASSERGIVRPSILAVGWLMTKSNLVHCTTGRFVGAAAGAALRLGP